jgi:hypothetical protein
MKMCNKNDKQMAALFGNGLEMIAAARKKMC